MTHPFSKAAVEAAMQAFVSKQFHEGMTDNNPLASAMNAALSAAFDHARGEGRVRSGKGYNDSDGGDAWDATTGGFQEPGGFPVTIIKDAES